MCLVMWYNILGKVVRILIDKDFLNLWLSRKELKALKKLSRHNGSEKKYSDEYKCLIGYPLCFARYTREIGKDEGGMPTYSEDYVKTTEAGLAYLKYLRDKKFERNIPVKISLVSLFLSALSTAAVVVRLLFDYFGKK